LERFTALNDDMIEPRLRLMEMAAEGAGGAGGGDSKDPDWRAVKKQAEQAMAISPLLPAPYRYLARATEALGERVPAIEAYRTLLRLDSLDLAGQHYHLAKLLFDENQLPEARHEVVLALEEAPRYREAHRLLLVIADKMDATLSTTERSTPMVPNLPGNGPASQP
jgi:tetratricopeptide (TPR) repeat protein